MKAISLWQPWATLVALGEKEFETRSWCTNHIGRLAICSTKRFDDEMKAYCDREPFRSVLAKHGLTVQDLPLGAIVAVVDVTAVFCTEDIASHLSQQERAFGNYKTGRYAWKLHLVQRLLKPIPVRGAQGLFEIDDDPVVRRV